MLRFLHIVSNPNVKKRALQKRLHSLKYSSPAGQTFITYTYFSSYLLTFYYCGQGFSSMVMRSHLFGSTLHCWLFRFRAIFCNCNVYSLQLIEVIVYSTCVYNITRQVTALQTKWRYSNLVGPMWIPTQTAFDFCFSYLVRSALRLLHIFNSTEDC